MNSEQQENLEININNLWANYFLPADSDNDGSVEQSELIDFMRDVLHIYIHIYVWLASNIKAI